MKLIRKVIKKLFSVLGYEIIRVGADTSSVRFENFKSLTKAYEQLLNESRAKKLVEPNEMRPKIIASLLGTRPSMAYHIVEALAKTKLVDGDVCEFGVAQGETSALIANEIREQDKKLHLFDSFEGLPKPTAKDKLKDDMFSLGSIEAYAGTMSCPESMVISRLEEISFPLDRYVIHNGFIEETIRTDETMPTKVSFAYVDFDFYEPTRIALSYLHSVTPCHAIVIVHDYDYFCTGVKTAVDEFIKEKNVKTKMYDIQIPGHFVVLTKKG